MRISQRDQRRQSDHLIRSMQGICPTLAKRHDDANAREVGAEFDWTECQAVPWLDLSNQLLNLDGKRLVKG